jgi:hypothetical protein
LPNYLAIPSRSKPNASRFKIPETPSQPRDYAAPQGLPGGRMPRPCLFLGRASTAAALILRNWRSAQKSVSASRQIEQRQPAAGADAAGFRASVDGTVLAENRAGD